MTESQPLPTRARPFMTRTRLFAFTAAAVAAAVTTAGWLTAAREVMYGAFLAVAIVAFLPFILVAAILLLMLVVSLLAAFAGGSADVGGVLSDIDASPSSGSADTVPGSGLDAIPIIGPYYRFLARRRHPVFWGIPAGLVLGALLLLALVAVFIAPGEARTAEALTAAQQHIDSYYDEHGSYPAPVDESRLRLADGSPHLADGFGNPLTYEVTGRWRVASYRLTSLGYDGEPGGDDLCVTGSTGLARAVDAVRSLVDGASANRSASDRLAMARSLRCE